MLLHNIYTDVTMYPKKHWEQVPDHKLLFFPYKFLCTNTTLVVTLTYLFVDLSALNLLSTYLQEDLR